jgi:hypothetical protein
LWALQFGNGGNGGNKNTLFITAGLNGEEDGLLAEINLIPEPGTFVLLGIGAAVVGLSRRKRTS